MIKELAKIGQRALIIIVQSLYLPVGTINLPTTEIFSDLLGIKSNLRNLGKGKIGKL
jgi:hypothetical protein